MIHTKDQVIRESEFPFRIFDAYGKQDSPLETPIVHRHDCLEINYVVSGRGYYLFDDKKYELQAGDIYVINNREYHMAYNTGDLHLIVVVFNADLVWNGSQTDYMYLKAFFERNDKESPFLKADLPVAGEIASLILNIYKEWKEKKPGYRIMVKADLLKILGMIYRHYEEMERFESHRSHPWGNHHSIIRVVDHINTHFREHLTLKEMAGMVHMSENYFSGIFSETMQMPFSRYVLGKRLQEACVLLKTTDRSITDIALNTGFDSVSYFNKAFKKNYRMSPGMYRANQKSADDSTKES